MDDVDKEAFGFLVVFMSNSPLFENWRKQHGVPETQETVLAAHVHQAVAGEHGAVNYGTIVAVAKATCKVLTTTVCPFIEQLPD